MPTRHARRRAHDVGVAGCDRTRSLAHISGVPQVRQRQPSQTGGMRKPHPLPAELVGRSFTLEQAKRLGVSRRRTESSDLETPSRGVRVPWGAGQPLVQSLQPLLAVTPGAVASFSTAARLWRMPLPGPVERDFAIHLTCPRGMAGPRRRGIRGHSMTLQASDISLLDGIPLTSPTRTFCDLAQILDVDALVAAGDSLVNRHHRSFGEKHDALASMEELSDVVRARKRTRGVLRARGALALVRVGSDSAPETMLRLALARAGLPEPALGFVIVDATGAHVAWPDLAFPEYRVALQYDGAHHFERAQQELDIARNEATARAGWTQVIITSTMMDAFGSRVAVVKVRDALLRNGRDGRRVPE